jgi:hypothetical protein
VPAPASYTEATLATYMHTVLGNTAAELGWSAPASYSEAINETLLSYGAATIDLATNVRKLRALARVEAWRLVVQQTAAEHDYSPGSGTVGFRRGQIQAQALAALAMAERDAAEYDDQYVVTVSPVRRAHDPYVYLDDAVRVVP